jgi:hypothetical protein
VYLYGFAPGALLLLLRELRELRVQLLLLLLLLHAPVIFLFFLSLSRLLDSSLARS